MPRRALWLLSLLAALAWTTGCAGRAAPPTAGNAGPATSTAPVMAQAPATPTPPPTPTPQPYDPAPVHLPFAPDDMRAIAYQAQFQVWWQAAKADAETSPVQRVRYIAARTFRFIPAADFWFPPEAEPEDLLFLNGTMKRQGEKNSLFAYTYANGQGLWMDSQFDHAWQAARPEAARRVFLQYYLAAVSTLPWDAFVWYPTDEGRDFDGLEARRYTLAVTDWDALSQRVGPDWFLAGGQLQTGRTHFEAFAAPSAAWVTDDGVLMALELALQGTFAGPQDAPQPVVLRLTYEVQARAETPEAAAALPVQGLGAASDLVLPPPETPPFIDEEIKKSTQWLGSPTVGIVWRVGSIALTPDDAAELLDLVVQVGLEDTDQFRGRGPEVPPGEALGRATLEDRDGQVWYFSAFADNLQIYQPPASVRLYRQEAGPLSDQTLAAAWCAYTGGTPAGGVRCLWPEGQACALDAWFNDEADCAFPPLGWQFPSPAAAYCRRTGGHVVADDAGLRCQFGANPQAACDLMAYFHRQCGRGGEAVQVLEPAAGQMTFVLQGHLRPGESVFYQIPPVEAFTPLELRGTRGQETPDIEMRPDKFGIGLESPAADVSLSIYRGAEQMYFQWANQPMYWNGFAQAILEVRGGGEPADYTLTIAGAPLLPQGNIPWYGRDTLDDSGVRYYMVLKPFSTWQFQLLQGPGVSVTAYAWPAIRQEPQLLARGRAFTLPVEPQDVLLKLEGPPNTAIEFFMLQRFADGP